MFLYFSSSVCLQTLSLGTKTCIRSPNFLQICSLASRRYRWTRFNLELSFSLNQKQDCNKAKDSLPVTLKILTVSSIVIRVYKCSVDNIVRLIWPRSDNLTVLPKNAKNFRPSEIFTTRLVWPLRNVFSKKFVFVSVDLES